MAHSQTEDASPTLHDCLALGAVEIGLKPSTVDTPGEIHRLPLLLRLLSQARPLSAVPTLSLMNAADSSTTAASDRRSVDNDDDAYDPVIEQAVARMEDRAALHSAAEGVHVVACHLAPTICKRISRLPPLRKKKKLWDTTELEIVAQHPLGTSSTTNNNNKQRRQLPDSPAYATPGNDDGDDELQYSDLDHSDEMDDGDNVEGVAAIKSKKRKSSLIDPRAASFANASEDSPEFAVLKTLQELARLTVASLSTTTTVSLSKIDDSTLAEAARQAESVGGAMVSGDLGSTVAALMHHAPVLRHKHVAVRTHHPLSKFH